MKGGLNIFDLYKLLAEKLKATKNSSEEEENAIYTPKYMYRNE